MEEEQGEGSAEERASRSQKKREDEARQVLANQIVSLNEELRRRLPLSDEARNAAREAAAIHPHVARRRAVLYVAGLLRKEDEAALRVALAGASSGAMIDPIAEEADAWLERLLSGDTTCLEEIGERRPDLDWTHLRQLVRNAIKEHGRGTASGPVEGGRAASRLRAYLLELAHGS